MGNRYLQLSADEHNAIQAGLNEGRSLRSIARLLERVASAVSR